MRHGLHYTTVPYEVRERENVYTDGCAECGASKQRVCVQKWGKEHARTSLDVGPKVFPPPLDPLLCGIGDTCFTFSSSDKKVFFKSEQFFPVKDVSLQGQGSTTS